MGLWVIVLSSYTRDEMQREKKTQDDLKQYLKAHFRTTEQSNMHILCPFFFFKTIYLLLALKFQWNPACLTIYLEAEIEHQ